MAPNTHRMNHQHLHIQSCMSQQKVFFCQTIAMSTKWRQLNVQAIKLIHYLWIMYRPVWQNDRRKIRHHCQIYASLLWCLSRPVWQAKDQASLPNSRQSSWTDEEQAKEQAKDQASLPNSCQSPLMPQLFQCCWLLKTIQWPNIHTSNISKRLKDQKPGSDIQSIKTKQYKHNTIYI